MERPKVTILVRTWNRAERLGRAFESARAQSFTDWELVAADDGSTDRTPEVVRAWQKKEPRVVYTRSETNQGVSKNCNRGFAVARGEYVAMMDDDDPWCDSAKLAEQVRFLDTHADYVGCGGGMIVVDNAGRELYRYLKPETDRDIRVHALFSNPMANSTTLFRRAAAREVGWYDESLPSSEDRDFWLKMGLLGKLYNFPTYFAYYTMSGRNISLVKMRTHLKASLLVVKRYRGKYPSYYPALVFNIAQYSYSFLPLFIRRPLHAFLIRLKRLVVK